MAITNNLRKLVHRKSWELMTPSVSTTGNGSFIDTLKDPTHPFYNMVFWVNGTSGVYFYDVNEDAWFQLPNSGAAGAFGPGSCGDMIEIGTMGGNAVQFATAGSTTTITTNRQIVRSLTGAKVRVIAGAGMGYEGKVASNTLGANSVITVTPASGTAFNSTTVFEVYSGSLLFFNAGTSAVGFSIYDIATNTWTAKSVTGLPTAFGTDGQLVTTTNIPAAIINGTSTAGSATTITTNKTLILNQIANYAIRIVSGTGAGQSRVIASNTAGANSVLTTSSATTALSAMTRAATGIVTATVASAAAPNLIPGRGYTVTGASDATFNAVYTILTVSGTTVTLLGANTTLQATAQTGTGQDTWITNPDATSVYAIEGDYNASYLGGNNGVTLYRYNLGANTWITLAPTAARAGAGSAGFTMDLVNSVPTWLETTIGTSHLQAGTITKQNGRFIYSLRGNGSNVLDVYDLALNTWISGVVYGNQNETFSTGSVSCEDGAVLYIQKDASGRIFQFDIDKNALTPFATTVYPQSTTVAGDKMFSKMFVDGANSVNFFYTMFQYLKFRSLLY
jgi:hypothetical protein